MKNRKNVITAEYRNGGLWFYVTCSNGITRRYNYRYVGRAIVDAFKLAFALNRDARRLQMVNGKIQVA